MRFFLPFMNDSTMIFAAAMSRILKTRGHDTVTALYKESQRGDAITARQIATFLPEGPDRKVDEDDLTSDSVDTFDAVITSMPSRSVRDKLAQESFRSRPTRPAYIAFQSGIDFKPENGRKNRANFDIVFLNNVADRDAFIQEKQAAYWQHVSFGHPYCQLPSVWGQTGKQNIYFFAQAVSPLTLESRKFVADFLCTLAARHPERDVYIKLRHLPSENANHKHREEFPYPDILADTFPNAPANLKLSACSMQEAIADAAFAITCTSTAVMDAISAGLPSMVYLDYVENYHDPLAEPMRKLFTDSNVIASLPQIMRLEAAKPSRNWLEQHFRGGDLFEELETAVGEYLRLRH